MGGMDEVRKKKNVGLTRKRADELVAILMDRIEMVNKDPQYIYGISRVSVFGSYLTDKAKLGDLDIAVEVGPKCRDPKRHWKLSDAQVRDEGYKRGGNIVNKLFWPQTKPVMALRGGHSAFSFSDYSDLEYLIEKGAAHREIYRNEKFDRKSFYDQQVAA